MNKTTIDASLSAYEGFLVEMRSIDQIIPYEKNARVITPENIDSLASLIKEYGFRVPVIVDEASVLIAGHTRLLAAQKLGLTEIPVHVARGLTKAQIRGLRISDNRVQQNTSWNQELLALELGELKLEGFDLGLTAFDAEELTGLLALNDGTKEGLTDEDEAPEAPVAPVSKLGDLWLLGNHRLLCGDSTNRGDVERLMDGTRADFIFTDPPYGVGFSYDSHKDEGGDRYARFMREIWHILQSFGCPVILTPGNNNVALWMSFGDFKMACWIKKNAMSPASIAHLNIFEILLLSGVKKKRNTDLFEYSVKQQEGVGSHPCPKLLDLVIDVIDSWAPKHCVLLEPFGGSGTTLIACEKTGRSSRLMEIDPVYIDVIIQRWQNFTGKEAIREDGVKFNDLKPVAAAA